MPTNKIVKKRGAQAINSVELLPREYWQEDDEPEIDGPRTNSSARRYSGEHHHTDTTIYKDDESAPIRTVTTRRATASHPPQSTRRTKTTTTQQRQSAAKPTIKNIDTTQHETWRTTQTQDQERETGKIKTRTVKHQHIKFHMLFYIGLAMFLLIAGWVIISLIGTLIQTTNLNNQNPLPKNVQYVIVHLNNGHASEVYGMIDAQDHLDAIVINDNGKVQFLPGQNVSAVVPDPQHCIITAVVSPDGKSVVIHARGPYVDQGFSAIAQEAQMVVSIDQISR